MNWARCDRYSYLCNLCQKVFYISFHSSSYSRLIKIHHYIHKALLFEILYCMVGSVSIIFGFVHQVLEVLFFNSNGHRKVLSLMKIGWYLICYTISNVRCCISEAVGLLC